MFVLDASESCKSTIQSPDQFVHGLLRRVEHQAGADDIAVEAAFADFADEDAARLRERRD
jgi:hypothetical protein